MVVKRDAPSFPTPSEYASPPSPAPSNDYSPTGKRIKSAKTPTPKKKSPAKPPKAKADGVITNEMKAELTEAAMDAAYKGGVAFSAYEAKFGISASRLKDQFKPNRTNLRQKIVESIGGGSK